MTCSLHVSANRIIGKHTEYSSGVHWASTTAIQCGTFTRSICIGIQGVSPPIDGDTLIVGSTVDSFLQRRPWEYLVQARYTKANVPVRLFPGYTHRGQLHRIQASHAETAVSL